MKLFNLRNVLVVIVLVVSVHSGRVVRDRRETPSESSSNIGGSISGFFSNLRSTLESGAHQVKDSVQGGYNFVKKKFSPGDENTSREESIHNTNRESFDTTTAAKNVDRIIFEGDEELDFRNDGDSDSGPTVEYSEVTTAAVSIEVTSKSNVTIDDRNAISAPITCPKGQRVVDQKCVAIVEF